MGESDKQAGWHWSEYWAAGHRDVMTMDNAEQREGASTTSVWIPWMSELNDGTRLLDLATGSGQLPRYALASAKDRGKTFQIEGIDYADIPSILELAAAGVVMSGGVAIEALPYPAEHFDAATSQYGIEYADHEPALSELARVLRPGANVRMLIHHADSEITRPAQQRIEAYDIVMGDQLAVRLAREAYGARLGPSTASTLETTRRAFLEGILVLARRTRRDPAYVTVRYLVNYLNDLAIGVDVFDPSSALECLDTFEHGNASWRLRQICQIEAALDRAGIEVFVERARRVGLCSTGLAPQHDERGGLIGWLASFERR